MTSMPRAPEYQKDILERTWDKEFFLEFVLLSVN